MSKFNSLTAIFRIKNKDIVVVVVIIIVKVLVTLKTANWFVVNSL